MKRKIKVAIFGAAGYVASVCIKNLLDRGAEIVAGLEIKEIGMDIGEAAGLDKIGVLLSDVKDTESVIKATKPDIALDCSLNTMTEIYDHAKICLENGVDFMAVGVYCYYPLLTDPDIAKEFDEIGKRTGASYLGSGSGELWQLIPQVASALGGSVKKISLEFNALLDCFGEASCENMGFGAPEEEWDQYMGEEFPSPWEHVDRLIAEKAGLHICGFEHKDSVVPAKEDMVPEGLGFVIKKGTLCGFADTSIVHTLEGVDIESVSYFKFGEEGETNSFTCMVEGEPNLKMVIEDFHGDVTTSIIMVNRIPDVIKSSGGVVMVNDLPAITYKCACAFEIDG